MRSRNIFLPVTLAVLILAAPARAERFTVQVVSTSQREQAERLVATLVGRDIPAYWSKIDFDGRSMYRVRVGSFEDRETAREFAEGLAGDLQLEYWIAPEEPHPLLSGSPSPSPPSPVANPAPSPAATPAASRPSGESAAGLLARAMAAHGGAEGGFTAVDRATSLVMRYRVRSLDAKTGDPVFSRHVYYRKGKDRLRLEIVPIEAFAAEDGSGRARAVASTTVASPDGAWVTAGENSGTLSGRTAKARIEALGPSGMLRLPLAFPRRGAAAAGISGRTEIRGSRTLNGDPAVRLDAVSPPSPYKEASLYVDPGDHRLMAARFITDAGELLLTFGDYREVAPGLIVPFRRRVYRDGAVVSSVEIDDLRLNVPLDASLFER